MAMQWLKARGVSSTKERQVVRVGISNRPLIVMNGKAKLTYSCSPARFDGANSGRDREMDVLLVPNAVRERKCRDANARPAPQPGWWASLGTDSPRSERCGLRGARVRPPTWLARNGHMSVQRPCGTSPDSHAKKLHGA